MKFLVVFYFLLLLHAGSYAQGETFDLQNLKFRGLSFSSSKGEIVKVFGEPEVVYPKYECGFYANDQPGGPYYQLVYQGFNYIGSDKENFLLENIHFDASGKTELLYNGKALNGRTTKADFLEIFGDYAKELFERYTDCTGIILYDRESDDGARFTFENGKLARFEYWSPC